jgi:hypothetical protein
MISPKRFDDLLLAISSLEDGYILLESKGEDLSPEQIQEIEARSGIDYLALKPNNEPVLGWIFCLSKDTKETLALVPEIVKKYGGSNVKISRVPELENSKVIGDII